MITYGLAQGRPTWGPRAIFGPPRLFEWPGKDSVDALQCDHFGRQHTDHICQIRKYSKKNRYKVGAAYCNQFGPALN